MVTGKDPGLSVRVNFNQPEQGDSVPMRVEILWGRIAIVFLFGVLVIGGLLSLVVKRSNDQPLSSSDSASQAALLGHSSSTQLTGKGIDKFAEPVHVAKPSIDQEQRKVFTSEERTYQSSDNVRTLKVEDVPIITNTLETPLESIKTKVVTGDKQLSFHPVNVTEEVEYSWQRKNFRDNLTAVRLSDSVDFKTLFISEVSLAGREIMTVYFSSDYQDLSGQTIAHEWYWQDQLMARIEGHVSSHVATPYSSKKIDRFMQGHWQVKVMNSQGQELGGLEFNVAE